MNFEKETKFKKGDVVWSLAAYKGATVGNCKSARAEILDVAIVFRASAYSHPYRDLFSIRTDPHSEVHYVVKLASGEIINLPEILLSESKETLDKYLEVFKFDSKFCPIHFPSRKVTSLKTSNLFGTGEKVVEPNNLSEPVLNAFEIDRNCYPPVKYEHESYHNYLYDICDLGTPVKLKFSESFNLDLFIHKITVTTDKAVFELVPWYDLMLQPDNAFGMSCKFYLTVTDPEDLRSSLFHGFDSLDTSVQLMFAFLEDDNNHMALKLDEARELKKYTSPDEYYHLVPVKFESIKAFELGEPWRLGQADLYFRKYWGIQSDSFDQWFRDYKWRWFEVFDIQ